MYGVKYQKGEVIYDEGSVKELKEKGYTLDHIFSKKTSAQTAGRYLKKFYENKERRTIDEIGK